MASRAISALWSRSHDGASRLTAGLDVEVVVVEQVGGAEAERREARADLCTSASGARASGTANSGGETHVTEQVVVVGDAELALVLRAVVVAVADEGLRRAKQVSRRCRLSVALEEQTHGLEGVVEGVLGECSAVSDELRNVGSSVTHPADGDEVGG